MSKYIILTKDERDALLKRAEKHNFGVNILSPVEAKNGTYILPICVIENGEFQSLYDELKEEGLIDKLKLQKTFTPIEPVKLKK